MLSFKLISFKRTYLCQKHIIKVYVTFFDNPSLYYFSLRSFLKSWTCFNISCSNSYWYWWEDLPSLWAHWFHPHITEWCISSPLDHSWVWVSWWIFDVGGWRRGCSYELIWRLSWRVSESHVISIHENHSFYNNLTSHYPISCSLSEHNYNVLLQVQETSSKSLSR